MYAHFAELVSPGRGRKRMSSLLQQSFSHDVLFSCKTEVASVTASSYCCLSTTLRFGLVAFGNCLLVSKVRKETGYIGDAVVRWRCSMDVMCGLGIFYEANAASTEIVLLFSSVPSAST